MQTHQVVPLQERQHEPVKPGDAELVTETLEEGLSRLSDGPVKVHAVSETPFTDGTSFALRRLEARLASGEVLDVVLKDLNPLRQSARAKHVRHLDLAPSRRERWMYEQVLPGLGLGTPRLYGSRWDVRRGHLWLLLEDLGRRRLHRTRDVTAYEQAATWAARFHEATAQWPREPMLRQLDQAHFERLGHHLRANLPRVPSEARELVERALDNLPAVAELPCGLIHGELFGKNVMLRPDHPTCPVAVIDWESAAYGPQLLDLVSLTAGRWTTAQRTAMRRAYFDQRRRGTDWSGFNESADTVALLQAVTWLDFWVRADPSEPKHVSRVSRWLRELRLALGDDG
jgi:aminoglycoside/choline kinase family phosphotransferase